MAGIHWLCAWLSRYGDLARLRRASALLPEGGSLFFACPKKSNPKKGPPGRGAYRAEPDRFACGLRGLSTGHPALTPNWPASMRATLRAIPPPARRLIRGPGDQEHPADGSCSCAAPCVVAGVARLT